MKSGRAMALPAPPVAPPLQCGAFRVRCVNFWEHDHRTTVESTTANVGLAQTRPNKANHSCDIILIVCHSRS